MSRIDFDFDKLLSRSLRGKVIKFHAWSLDLHKVEWLNTYWAIFIHSTWDSFIAPLRSNFTTFLNNSSKGESLTGLILHHQESDRNLIDCFHYFEFPWNFKWWHFCIEPIRFKMMLSSTNQTCTCDSISHNLLTIP